MKWSEEEYKKIINELNPNVGIDNDLVDELSDYDMSEKEARGRAKRFLREFKRRCKSGELSQLEAEAFLEEPEEAPGGIGRMSRGPGQHTDDYYAVIDKVNVFIERDD